MKHTDYCSKCKQKNVPLLKYSKPSNTQYYLCRPCNAQRINKYAKTDAGKQVIKGINTRHYRNNPSKVSARQAVRYAIKNGHIIKPSNCSKCSANGRIEGHHDDYTNKLSVQWLCSSCHAGVHAVVLT